MLQRSSGEDSAYDHISGTLQIQTLKIVILEKRGQYSRYVQFYLLLRSISRVFLSPVNVVVLQILSYFAGEVTLYHLNRKFSLVNDVF